MKKFPTKFVLAFTNDSRVNNANKMFNGPSSKDMGDSENKALLRSKKSLIFFMIQDWTLRNDQQKAFGVHTDGNNLIFAMFTTIFTMLTNAMSPRLKKVENLTEVKSDLALYLFSSD